MGVASSRRLRGCFSSEGTTESSSDPPSGATQPPPLREWSGGASVAAHCGMSPHSTHVSMVLLMGDSGVGLTSLNNCTARGELTDPRQRRAFTACDFEAVDVPLPLRPIRLRVCDPFTHERPSDNPSLLHTKHWLRYADGILLVFDVNRRDSFEHMPQLLAAARAHVRQRDAVRPLQFVLLGNKANESGRDGQRQVGRAEAEGWAQQNGLAYYETSCVSGSGVTAAYEALAALIYENTKDDAVEQWKEGQSRDTPFTKANNVKRTIEGRV